MSEIDREIVSNLQKRGYLTRKIPRNEVAGDKYSNAELIARQIVKMVEESFEAWLHVRDQKSPIRSDLICVKPEFMCGLTKAHEYGKKLFDEDICGMAKMEDMGLLLKELADMRVVMSMIVCAVEDAFGIDLDEMALNKSCADVARGKR